MKRRILILIVGFIVVSIKMIGQEIHGLIIDSKSESPLAFVNIGVIGISHGTVTNESGAYNLACDKLPKDCKIQISMIGYESQTLNLKDLIPETKTIRLVQKTYALDEVTIKWKDIIRKVGTTKTSITAGVCGWGGTDFGRGHELGLLLTLGDNPVSVKDINLNIRKHSFDTIVFRLHFRSIENGLPYNELLTENIYLPITKSSGWQQFDLSDFNILISGQVALTIEWVKISNVIEKKLIKMNGSKQATPNVLFDMTNKQGTLFRRRGSAAKWKTQENSSPGFYITIKE